LLTGRERVQGLVPVTNVATPRRACTTKEARR
jgi:hypothetical protein